MRYEGIYREFNSPLMRRIRQQAYGDDIGQHSWVSTEELRADLERLKLNCASTLLDLGCGPGGPLTFLVAGSGCRATGLDIDEAALVAAGERICACKLGARIELRAADLDRLPELPECSFDAVVAYDVVLHVKDRRRLFEQAARLLAPGGRLLFTDAGVLTGAITPEQLRIRGAYGPTQIVAQGFNERMLEGAGLQLCEREDRSTALRAAAAGRLQARAAHRHELMALEGEQEFASQQDYLAMVAVLAQSGSLSRWMYLAQI